jgi:bacteriorhodopsin
MINEDYLYNTKIISFFVQIFAGILGIYSLFSKIPLKDFAVLQSLRIEMFVQLIQISMYIWLIFNFHVPSMALTRYIDWIITTPLMLLSLMLYFKYEKNIEENKNTDNLLYDFLNENIYIYFIVFISNLIMLLFGLLGEINYISKKNATIGGFFALLITLSTIYEKLASKSKKSMYIFIPFSIVWSLYGIAYILDDIPKNIFYNILDVIAKNFFGIFLSIKVLSLSI